MARRKKEEPEIHRVRIAEVAQKLFNEQGMEHTTMNDIARVAGYSKATLYVYFKDKEELIAYLVCMSMKTLLHYVQNAVTDRRQSTHAIYLCLCKALEAYQAEYPIYFDMALEPINIDFEHSKFAESEIEAFQIGEQVNRCVLEFFKIGEMRGDLQGDLCNVASVFTCWGMISGIIKMAMNKKDYIVNELHMTKEGFLIQGYERFYQSIVTEQGRMKIE